MVLLSGGGVTSMCVRECVRECVRDKEKRRNRREERGRGIWRELF